MHGHELSPSGNKQVKERCQDSPQKELFKVANDECVSVLDDGHLGDSPGLVGLVGGPREDSKLHLTAG